MAKLTLEEQRSYNIAVCAATGRSFDQMFDVCYICKGCGLLRHPTEHMHVAPCYMCNGRGLIVHQDIEQPDRREICNASTRCV